MLIGLVAGPVLGSISLSYSINAGDEIGVSIGSISLALPPAGVPGMPVVGGYSAARTCIF